MNTRAATENDSDFVYHAKVDALKEYIHKTWGWNEDVQKEFHKGCFNSKETEIIQVDGEDAGFLIVKEEEEEIELKEINLLRKFQNKKIGSGIIQEIIDLGRKDEKAIRLQVLKVNPAINLYKRFGFDVYGETDTHYLMKTKG